MQNQTVLHQPISAAQEAVRLHYLDTLRVIPRLGVLVLHVTCVFNEVEFHIKNVEESAPLTTFGASARCGRCSG